MTAISPLIISETPLVMLMDASKWSGLSSVHSSVVASKISLQLRTSSCNDFLSSFYETHTVLWYKTYTQWYTRCVTGTVYNTHCSFSYAQTKSPGDSFERKPNSLQRIVFFQNTAASPADRRRRRPESDYLVNALSFHLQIQSVPKDLWKLKGTLLHLRSV